MDNKTNCIKKGGKKPHAHFLPMMALVLFGMIALVGVVAADNIWGGTPPVTKVSDVVNGSVCVNMSDTDPWNNSVSTSPGYTTRDPQNVLVNLTLPVIPANVDLKVARLYVTVYGGNNTAHADAPDWYYGNVSVGVCNRNLVDSQPLSLTYDNTSTDYNKTAYDNSISYPLLNLSRVNSDYLAIIDMKDNISDLNTNNLEVNVTSYNISGKFDGRIKEVKSVLAWNVTSGSTGDTYYWINEGHDPMTRWGDGSYNETWYYNTGIDPDDPEDTYNATLWIDYLSSSSSSGSYMWNAETISPSLVKQYKYSGLKELSWSRSSGIGMDDDNRLRYKINGTTLYKMIVSVLSIKKP